jgi:hypothetical protein
MSSARVELDKQFTTEAGETYGTISIRVVVLKTPSKDDKDDDEDVPPAELEEDIDLADTTRKSPLASYLEKQAYGKWCIVFLVNGQRHHAWDKTFIVKDLGFNQLRDRTMVIVDLDGLTMEASTDIIQGSRQGLFEGPVLLAIRQRIVQTLKSDPELKKLQLDAEQRLLEMQGGDEAVKNKLDQLIEGHHAAAHADGAGEQDAGPYIVQATHFGTTLKANEVVVMGRASIGQEGELPVLVTEPRVAAVRMHPGESRKVVVAAYPREEWASLQEIRVQLGAQVDGMSIEHTQGQDSSSLNVRFDEAHDYEDEDYPVQGEVQVFARFKNRVETRMLKLPVVVTKKKPTRERIPIELLDEPTYLKVTSRQPVKIMPGGSPVHVKLEWNGREALIRGANPPWRITARRMSLSTFPTMGFGSMGDGRLELVVYPPHGLLPESSLDFEVVAEGPEGRRMPVTFRAVVMVPPPPPELGPRKLQAKAPDTAGQRRPPYELKYVHQKDWDNPTSPRWDGNEWTGEDAGRYEAPSETNPLILIVNHDMELLRNFREDMVKRKLTDAVVKERCNRYVSHVAFHLYQMYLRQKKKLEAKTNDETVRPLTEVELQEQINDVGGTLMRLMELTQR